MTVPLRQYAHSGTKDALPGSEQLSELKDRIDV